jgi:hypothetical protein
LPKCETSATCGRFRFGLELGAAKIQGVIL